MTRHLAVAALALGLIACSSGTPGNEAGEAQGVNVALPDPAANDAAAPVAEASGNVIVPAPRPAPAGANVLTLEGLGPLRIGEPVPEGSGWAERGAQISDACRTVSAPDHPGVYAIVEDGRVRRITVGQSSDVRLIEGIGAGASEAEVRSAFPGFRETPHKYVDAPGKYLTAPNAASGDPALRFEIGADGRVSLIHVGTMPVLGYVEGCA